MEFTKYNSLKNTSQTKFLFKVTSEGLDGGLFVATEKIHGANFSIWFDGVEFKTGMRNGFSELPWMDAIKSKYFPEVKAMYQMLVYDGTITFCDTVAFFGEVFGGCYHGVQGLHAKKIQKGVHYTPDTEFLLFDILVDTCNVKSWVSYSKLCEMVDDTTMLRVPEISKGSLEDMLSLNNEFPTVVPELLGLELPSGVDEHSQCEGFVIRPVHGEKYLRNGSRIIFKNRTTAFSENKTANSKTLKDVKVSVEDKVAFEEVCLGFTRSRLLSVISKEWAIDDVTWKMITLITGRFIQDVLEEYLENHDKSSKDFKNNLKAPKQFYKHLQTQGMIIVRSLLLEIL